MSVLIKGMEMPKRHLFEAFVAIGDGQIVVKDLDKNKLFEGKIEEVPTPHGRLIDADELIRCLPKWLADTDVMRVFERIIKRHPTITEAEVSE